ncbi:hypothetical protein BPTFM16_01079 [Altererythrobacter insulae]|nr:hypothetical protein BPTFM16_01079 [Altererythrobacter insulae]
MSPRSLAAALSIAICLSSSPPSLAQEVIPNTESSVANEQLSVAQVRRDLMIAQDAYSKIHPGYTRYASEQEMDEAWGAILRKAEAQGGLSAGDLYLEISLALTKIRCDHTKAELPIALAEARKGQPLYLPFIWKMVEGRALVVSSNGQAGLDRGDEIISIDGRPIDEAISAVSKYLPVDGYTEWSRNGGIAYSSEFMGGAVDHFGALLWDVPPVATLGILSESGQQRQLNTPRASFEEIKRIHASSGRATNFKDAVRFEREGADTAVLAVDTSVNYRDPVDPESIFGPIFAAIAKEGRNKLILDLRENGGGSTDVSISLLANLIDDQRPFKRELRVATLDHTPWDGMINTWAPQALNPDPRGFIANADGSFTLRQGIMEDTSDIVPTDNAFNGRLIVLTSSNNSSGVTNILASLQSRPNTVTVGEPTGGSVEGPTAGVIFFLTLPESGTRLRIPMFRQWNNVDTFEAGMGITPGVAAPLTVAAFRAGKDPALEAALMLARSDARDIQEEPSQLNVSASDFADLEGDDWIGQLDYLNYGSDQRSQIPVKMIVEAPQKRRVPYGFIYPGEENKNANDTIRISKDGTRIDGMDVVSRSFVDGVLVIVAEGTARDDNRPAEIRVTYTVAANRFSVRKDVRFAGGNFINRNEYLLTR